MTEKVTPSQRAVEYASAYHADYAGGGTALVELLTRFEREVAQEAEQRARVRESGAIMALHAVRLSLAWQVMSEDLKALVEQALSPAPESTEKAS